MERGTAGKGEQQLDGSEAKNCTLRGRELRFD